MLNLQSLYITDMYMRYMPMANPFFHGYPFSDGYQACTCEKPISTGKGRYAFSMIYMYAKNLYRVYHCIDI